MIRLAVGQTTLGATTNYLYDGPNVVQELSAGSPSANLLTGGVDEVFARTDSLGTRDFLSDALGGTIALTDPTGNGQCSKLSSLTRVRDPTIARIILVAPMSNRVYKTKLMQADRPRIKMPGPGL